MNTYLMVKTPNFYWDYGEDPYSIEGNLLCWVVDFAFENPPTYESSLGSVWVCASSDYEEIVVGGW